jgi:MraZ protein
VPSDEFESMATDLKERVRAGEITRQYQRAVAASATPVTIDKQGRVNVEEKLRAFAGLATEAKVIVTGNFDVVEIWSPERFELVQAAGTNDLAGLLTSGPGGVTS